MDLADVLAHNERLDRLTRQTVADPDPNIASTSLTASHKLVGAEANAAAAGDQGAITNGTGSLSHQAASVSDLSETPKYLHVFASVNYMWLAVAGHGVDNEKIAALEFTCLSVIAAHREAGILQPDLVRTTGQDKRSVPWRTQKLCDKGYIVKKEVVSSGSRTSLCILKRFAVPCSSKDVTTKAQYLNSLPNRISTSENKGYVDAKSRVVQSRIRATFEILKELKIILWDDLKMKLGIWRIARDSKRLASIIRKLELLKCVQRVKASDEKYGALHRCVKLLREPTQEEYDMLCDTKHKMTDFMVGTENDAGELDLENYSIKSPARVEDGSDDTAQLNNDAFSARTLLWTPDRLMVNILRDAVALLGSMGSSSSDIKNTVVGAFFERPLENLLTRLVEVWQLSQPLHLRHLAILRDITLRGKTQQYVYYEYDVFKSLVDAGNASWEAVETVRLNNPQDPGSNAAPGAIQDTDEYGFPKLDEARFQGRDNKATLAGSLAATKIAKFRVTAADASITMLENGRYGKMIQENPFNMNGSTNNITAIKRGTIREYRSSKSIRQGIGKRDNKDATVSEAKMRGSGTEENKIKRNTKRPEDSEKPRKPLGRPRKHPKAGIPEDASKLTLKQLYTIKASQRAAMEYERSKITNKIASRIEQGEDEADSTESVLAEVAARNKANPDAVVSEALANLASTARKRKHPAKEGTSYSLGTYMPSVSADNFLNASKPLMKPQKKVKFLSTDDNEKILTPYLPSIPAHSILIGEESTTNFVESTPAATLDDLIFNISRRSASKRKLYRSRKFHSAVGYFPSTLAHTNPNLAYIDEPATKTRKSLVKPLNDGNGWDSVSPNNAAQGYDSVRISTSGLHELNPGDSSKPVAAIASPQPFPSPEPQSDTSLPSSEVLQYLVPHSQEIGPSTSRKRRLDNELHLVSYKASKRPRTSLSSGLNMASTVETGSYESEIGYLPSVAAHSHFWFGIPGTESLTNIVATAKKMPRPRKKTAKALEVEIMEQMVENSISAQSPQRLRPTLTYAEQLESITRDGIGVHLGKLSFLKRAHRRGRGRQCRLVVFRSPRLSDLAWFLPESTLPEAAITGRLSPVQQDMSKGSEDKTLLVFPENPWESSQPHDQSSRARDKFLSSVRDAIRLSKPAELATPVELSYPILHTAVADGQSPSIPSTQNRKRKRNSSSSDTRQPLQKKPSTNTPSWNNSHTGDFSPEEPPVLPRSANFGVIPSTADLPTSFPSKEQDTLQQPISPKPTAGAPSIYANERNLTRSKESCLVTADVASTATDRGTTSSLPVRDQIRPEAFPSTNMLCSTETESSQQTHESFLIQNSVDPGFEASTCVTNTPAIVSPDTICYQEEQTRNTLDATKNTTSNTPMETTLSNSQTPDFVLESSIPSLTYSNAAPTIVRVNTTGGSIAVLRRKIIMEIIDHCGGVFPGDREIWQPFCDVWKSRNCGGKPDHRTVLAAVKHLVDNGKLRKLKFTFSHEGVATTRSIVTSPDISPTDPKVMDLRQKMIIHVDTSSRPKPYIPEEAKIFLTSVEVVDKPISTPHAPDTFRRTWINCPEVAEEQVKLQYPARLKRSSRGILISQAMENRRREKEERQGFVQNLEEEMNEPGVEIGDYGSSKTPSLSGTEGTPHRRPSFNSTSGKLSRPMRMGNVRKRKPTLADGIAGSPIIDTYTNSRRLKRLHVTKARPNFLNQHNADNGRPNSQNLDQLAKTSSTNAYKHLRFMEVMDQHSNFDRELSPEPADIDEVQNWLLLDDQGHEGLDPPGEGKLLSFQPEYRQSRTRKIKAKKIHKIIQGQLQDIGLQYRVAARQRRGKFIKAKYRSVFPPDFAHMDMQISSLMDPEHLFHVTTGTFSTSFAGILEMVEVPDMPESPFTGGFNYPIGNTEVELPHSLQDVLSAPYDFKLVAYMERTVRVGFNPDHDPFLETVDKVRKWELGTPSLANTTSKDWRFINFQLLEPQETVDTRFKESYFIDPGVGGGMKRLRQRNSTITSSQRVIPTKRPAPVSRQPARRVNVARLSTTPLPVIDVPVDADGRAFKKPILRGPRLQAVSPEDDDRILVAVLVVRTLVGGSEQHIDWVLLARMFGSRFSERLLHRRWVSVRVRYKRNLEKLQSDIQDMFLQAYENDTIPLLDFDNYDNYDWDSLVDWTMKNLETPVNNLNKDLPDSRTKLDNTFELRKSSVTTSELALFYELESICSVPRRHVVIQRKPHVVPLHMLSITPKTSSVHDIAKTWVRANVMTPDKGYDANMARDKLISLGEPNVEAAVKDLLSARVILHTNKGRLIPGRNYDMTDYCLTRLRKKISTHTFRQAAAYKVRLDAKFEEEGSVAFSYHTRDAEVIAILNLAAHGRISILPKNPPMKTFGLVDNGYRTRHMDKARLNFDIELKPTASYVRGNPLLPLPPPPGVVSCTFSSLPHDTAQSHGVSVESEPTMERLPFWVGINNSFIPTAWDLALAAVLSLAVIQPGVDPSELAKTLRPAVEDWEVALIFQWCVESGVATWSDERAGKSGNGGVKVAEWWWMVYGKEGTGEEMDTRED
ncbi:hypothetical protein MMC26_000938 [Xylographa opegraphella]|nr:hypothetical protein [Xylographa opegraphella]